MEAGNISRSQVVPGVEEMVEWGWVAKKSTIGGSSSGKDGCLQVAWRQGTSPGAKWCQGWRRWWGGAGWQKNPPLVVQVVVKMVFYR